MHCHRLILLGIFSIVNFVFLSNCGREIASEENQQDTVYATDTIVSEDTIIIHDTVWQIPADVVYMGSQSCRACHQQIYDKFQESGHPHILKKIGGNSAPLYPGFITPPELPDNYSSWDQLQYVIGGFMREAQFFIDNNGFMVGGNADTVAYSCGSCHTTGYNASGIRRDSLAGIEGTWSEPGVQCEACHGAGGRHIATNGLVPAAIDRSPDFCGKCHASEVDSAVAAYCLCDSGYNMHGEIMGGKKAIMNCVDCHDPHASTHHDQNALGKGIQADCEDCHPSETKSFQAGSPLMDSAGVVCVDCHMPRIAGSARTHLFYISTDLMDNQFNENLEPNPWISLDFACLSCHGSDTSKTRLTGKNRAWAAAYAGGVHNKAADTTVLYVEVTDFDLDIISSNTSRFRDLTGRKLFIFYASAGCPHCRAAITPVHEFAQSLDSIGVTTVIVFNAYSSLASINALIADSNITLPVYQDADFEFFPQYGEGYVPMFMAVNQQGEWLRTTGYSEVLFATMKENYLEFWQ